MSGDTFSGISCIQVAGDPTKWWLGLDAPIQPGQQREQPLTAESNAPITGVFVLSKSARVTVLNEPISAMPLPLNASAYSIYLPTAAGVSAGHTGHELPDTVNPGNLINQVTTLMQDGRSETITLGGAGGTLVLDGAKLSFVVIGITGWGGGSMPHDVQPT
jgi:hypothetical protein